VSIDYCFIVAIQENDHSRHNKTDNQRCTKDADLLVVFYSSHLK